MKDQDRATFFHHVDFKGKQSKSGPGSEGLLADMKKKAVLKLIELAPHTNVLDLGCGDLYWMKDLLNRFDRYTGVDIHKGLIKANHEKYSSDSINFIHADVLEPASRKFFTDTYNIVICYEVEIHLYLQECDSLIDFIFNFIQPEFFLFLNKRLLASEAITEGVDSRWVNVDLTLNPVFKSRPSELVYSLMQINGTHEIYRFQK